MSFNVGGGGGISSATDVALSNPADDHVLTYDGAIGKWQNQNALVTSVNTQTGAVNLTKADVGLSAVDNTADLDKPVSTATQTALNAKASSASLAAVASSGSYTDLTNKPSIPTVSDATTTGKGVVQLAGDLAGTAAAPTVPGLAAKATDSAVVHNTGAETVAGIKTFSSSPVVPTPVNTTDAANKTYVDSVASSGAPDATTSVKGVVKLAGDLGGTAALPTVPGLAAKLPLKNGNPQLTDSTNDKFARVDISDDASPTASWPDRLAFYFNGVRSGYHNEYGELRARPAKSNTIAFRCQKWASASTVDIMQVTSSDNVSLYFTVGPTSSTLSVPLSSTANISTTGTVSGSNIGNKVTASSTAPSSPAVGDVWIDLSA
jgi:hypothetical protein